MMHSRWYCSENCGRIDPQTADLRKLYDQGIEFEQREGLDDDEDSSGELNEDDFEL